MNQKAEELRALDDGELLRALDETHHELFNLRFGLATRQQANTAELAKVRRKIARVLTIARERELEG